MVAQKSAVTGAIFPDSRQIIWDIRIRKRKQQFYSCRWSIKGKPCWAHKQYSNSRQQFLLAHNSGVLTEHSHRFIKDLGWKGPQEVMPSQRLTSMLGQIAQGFIPLSTSQGWRFHALSWQPVPVLQLHTPEAKL